MCRYRLLNGRSGNLKLKVRFSARCSTLLLCHLALLTQQCLPEMLARRRYRKKPARRGGQKETSADGNTAPVGGADSVGVIPGVRSRATVKNSDASELKLPHFQLSFSKEEIDSASKSARFAPTFALPWTLKRRRRVEGARVRAIHRRSSVDDVLDSTHCGWLKKEGGFVKSWKRRWFVLHRGYLRYFCQSRVDGNAW